MRTMLLLRHCIVLCSSSSSCDLQCAVWHILAANAAVRVPSLLSLHIQNIYSKLPVMQASLKFSDCHEVAMRDLSFVVSSRCTLLVCLLSHHERVCTSVIQLYRYMRYICMLTRLGTSFAHSSSTHTEHSV
jgi:hypothetical protein